MADVDDLYTLRNNFWVGNYAVRSMRGSLHVPVSAYLTRGIPLCPSGLPRHGLLPKT